ncbi:MAG TPA: orange carotenoid protein N-terminal domain-containing protein [Candidatus Caenarcaniphilales bacterium]
MPQNPNTDRSQFLPEETLKAVQAFENLDTDAKLGWFYLIYKKMGDSVTPAAPQATDPELAPLLMGDYFTLSDEDQLAIMRDIVDRKDTDYSRAYGVLKENNQLMVWYAWAQAMGDTVVDLPNDYQATNAINELLGQLENLDFEQQISMFREIASNMGYTDIQPAPSQAETGKTSSL